MNTLSWAPGMPRFVFPALVGLVIGASATFACASEGEGYKLVINHRAVFGRPVDSTHFRTCSGWIVTVPPGAALVRSTIRCPEITKGANQLFGGKAKLKLPKAAPSATADP